MKALEKELLAGGMPVCDRCKKTQYDFEDSAGNSYYFKCPSCGLSINYSTGAVKKFLRERDFPLGREKI